MERVEVERVDVDVCVAGGGPAGLFAALLLARRGVRVVVLERHADFLRDFRGDTVHPSTLDLLDEMGLGAEAEALPHRDVAEARATFADGTRTLVDFSRLRVAHPHLRFVPQWDLLEMLAGAGAGEADFALRRATDVRDLVRRDGVVRGVTAEGPDGPLEVRARLVIGADGRASTVRDRLALRPRTFGAPMDVLWFRLPRRDDEPAGLDVHVGAGQMLVGIDRGDYWQSAFVIPKGGYDAVVAAGLPAFRASLARLVPRLADRVGDLASLDDVKVLTVRIDRLRRWHVPGALLIGDAAHAMSPVGGVGINLAVQDAVAAARLLAGPLRRGTVGPADLAGVQIRRAFPTAGTQLLQRVIQRAIIARALDAEGPVPAPWPIRLIDAVPALRALPARLVGLGLRPEHVGA